MPDDTLPPHTSHRFDAELSAIRTKMMNMGGMVEEQLRNALSALVDGNEQLAEQVVSSDHDINVMEMQIDRCCTDVFARRSPVALDLRFLIAVLKTITELEGIGDEAKQIGAVASRLTDTYHRASHVSQIEHLGERIKRMLHTSLDALARFDTELANTIPTEAVKVDHDYDAIMRQMLTIMMEDPRNIPEVMQLCWVARALERISDRSRSICDFVIYVVKGKDVRYSQSKEIVADSETALSDNETRA
jgi:phosphate transport system protein